MDLNELNEWTKSEEGKAWLEQAKLPLVEKRNQLLEELKASNARLASEALRANEAQDLFTAEKMALSRVVVDEPLKARLREARVFEDAIPGLARALSEAHGFEVVADGDDRKAQSKEGKSISEIVDLWSTTPEARRMTFAKRVSGGGAQGYAQDKEARMDLKNMSAEDILANLPALTRK